MCNSRLAYGTKIDINTMLLSIMTMTEIHRIQTRFTECGRIRTMRVPFSQLQQPRDLSGCVLGHTAALEARRGVSNFSNFVTLGVLHLHHIVLERILKYWCPILTLSTIPGMIKLSNPSFWPGSLFSTRAFRNSYTGGLNIGQLTWNEPNKWLVPFFLCYHTDQDSYDGWRKNCSLSWNWSPLKGENPQINQRMMVCGVLKNYLDILVIQIKA